MPWRLNGRPIEQVSKVEIYGTAIFFAIWMIGAALMGMQFLFLSQSAGQRRNAMPPSTQVFTPGASSIDSTRGMARSSGSPTIPLSTTIPMTPSIPMDPTIQNR
jgi:hypothetical protein